ncbi:MAG: hypothetical protein BMS9Abin36_0933 [Gammaproteobacteria bacterium]|nr:MAG: hypothetical protein BMS9Abin36_0933 [Gammaproteobacteria bacterium]
MDNAIIDLQARIAFLEDAQQQFNQLITEQQQQIGALQQALHETRDLLKELKPSPVGDIADETPPPHY